MDGEGNTCSKCNLLFNETDRLPRILTGCGHTYCTSCIKSLMANVRTSSIVCPLDQRPSTFSRSNDIESFPVNLSLKKLLERKDLIEWQRCNEHDEPMKLICMTDKCKICSHCWILGTHRTHEIKSMKDINNIVDLKIREYEDMLNKLEKYYKSIKTLLQSKVEFMLKNVDGSFKKLALLLKQKQEELVLQITDFRIDEEGKLEDLMGSDSNLCKSLKEKVAELRSVLKDDSKLDKLNEDNSDLKARLNADAFEKNFAKFSAGLVEVTKSLEEKLDVQRQVAEDLVFYVKELSLSNNMSYLEHECSFDSS